MKKLLVASMAVLALAGSGVAYAVGNGPQARPSVAAQQSQTTFAIKNMTCATCPITVRKAMQGVSGVSAVSVDFKTKTARTTYDPRRTSPAQIAAASTNAGYPARAIKN